MSCRARPLGADESPGWFGRLARLHLDHAPDESGPSTLILKLSSADRDMRERPETIAAYRREIAFYERLASRVPVRTPHCYYAALDEASGHHVLLLEDLAPARCGSAHAPCPPERAERAVREIARVHAAWWDAPEGRAQNEALPDADALRVAHDAWWPTFVDRAGDRVPVPLLELGEALGALRGQLWRHLNARSCRTLVHGDYKLENLFFQAEDGGGVPFAVIDWQLMRWGRGVWDVAYLAGQSLDVETRRRTEAALLDTYHAALRSGGVTDYALDQCWLDYRLSLLARFGALISTIAAMPFRHETIRLHVEVFLQRNLEALRDHDAVSLAEGAWRARA